MTPWIPAIIQLNWANMLQNRKAFWAMMLAMCLQNIIYFGLWVVIFSQISSLRGWGLREVGFLFASGAMGYGLMFTVFGGLNMLGETIHSGALDAYLARPQPVLALVLLQRMRADSLGDVLTGLVMLGLFVQPPMRDWPLILVLTVTAGMVFFAFRLITHSLAFWGLSSDAAEGGFNTFLITGTNPQQGFNPWLKLGLLTVFPAGYIGLLPVEILRHFRWDYFALQIVGSSTCLAFSIWLFYRGLRRYKSGNKFITLR